MRSALIFTILIPKRQKKKSAMPGVAFHSQYLEFATNLCLHENSMGNQTLLMLAISHISV